MPMNVLQQAADRLGYLVYAMNQADSAPLAEDENGEVAPGPWGHVQGGYCVGISTRWIALRYAAHDYPFDKATKIASIDWQATRDHNVHGQAKQGNPSFPEKYKAVFGQYGLQLNLGAVTAVKAAMSGPILKRAGLMAEGCHFIRMAGTGGAHAVAMANQGAHGWRFFDPNFGHFRLPDANAFDGFIDWFMIHSGYRQNGFLSRRLEVVHINPPPYTGASFASVMKILTNKLDR
ncbi:YopT-type cysteine protease domain-containing protein [Plastoroseomonas hellenica]|uniref:YopT-type cysteine protease domain-containing protein n=1 Tax=Plastoroseomonas hellenica TaxID=2687306 RepID=UPI001BABF634|nr:YopT-type cysteine protease domain-containing protein [Plastoroseomonas hellenica]MBR0644340.1 hypothetical protein [Plastoroseomonas hellenica]